MDSPRLIVTIVLLVSVISTQFPEGKSPEFTCADFFLCLFVVHGAKIDEMLEHRLLCITIDDKLGLNKVYSCIINSTNNRYRKHKSSMFV